jgi:hypothetical protein
MARPPTNVDLKFSRLRVAGDRLAQRAIFNRQSEIRNRQLRHQVASTRKISVSQIGN